MLSRHVHIIVNDHAGSGLASSLSVRLADRLTSEGIPYSTYTTNHAGHASELGQDILNHTVNATIAVIGGDGTLHELINGIMTAGHAKAAKVEIILIPSGTANALYHSLFPETCANPADYDRFLSVEAALSSGKKRPLSLLDVTRNGKHVHYSHVVTSTSMHAQLLETASTPEMRKLYPGPERFMKAAEMHIGTACAANLTLTARGEAGIQRWSPIKSVWETVSAANLDIAGLFTYFVSALVDRFEAKFRIAPLSAPGRDRPANAVDVVLVRAKQPSSDGREAEAKRLMEVLMAAYSENGKHLQVQEDIDGTMSHVVEYYRASGFEWKPVSIHSFPLMFRTSVLIMPPVKLDEAARSVCVDGTSLRLEAKDTLRCTVLSPEAATASFSVWA